MKTQKILLFVALMAIGQCYANTTEASNGTVPDTTAQPTTVSPTTTPEQSSTGTDVTTDAANTTTTEKPTTTTEAPKTTTTPKPTSNVFTWKVKEGNETCIMLKMGATMAFAYKDDKNKTITKNIDLPKGEASGKCNTSITLTFNTNWTLTFNFATEEKDYMVKQVDFTFYTAKAIFPGITVEENVMASRTNASLFKAPIGQSYKCNNQPNFSVTSSGTVIEVVNINTTELQIEAFRLDAKDDFGTALDCDEDTTVNNLVPIVVGAALAGLVLIVLIAYLIGRRKSRRGYESV